MVAPAVLEVAFNTATEPSLMVTDGGVITGISIVPNTILPSVLVDEVPQLFTAATK
ncbi:hypothetical protein D3C87_910470 [compost metagenome]